MVVSLMPIIPVFIPVSMKCLTTLVADDFPSRITPAFKDMTEVEELIKLQFKTVFEEKAYDLFNTLQAVKLN